MRLSKPASSRTTSKARLFMFDLLTPTGLEEVWCVGCRLKEATNRYQQHLHLGGSPFTMLFLTDKIELAWDALSSALKDQSIQVMFDSPYSEYFRFHPNMFLLPMLPALNCVHSVCFPLNKTIVWYGLGNCCTPHVRIFGQILSPMLHQQVHDRTAVISRVYF